MCAVVLLDPLSVLGINVRLVFDDTLTLICISFNARKVNFFCLYPKYTDTCMTMNFTTFCTPHFIRSQASFMVVYRRVRSLMRRVNMHSEVY